MAIHIENKENDGQGGKRMWGELRVVFWFVAIVREGNSDGCAFY
jgi:hypothetical protein